MTALIIGIVLLLFTVFSILPAYLHGLGWGQDIILFLRGSLPIFAAFIGLFAIFIGIADIKDKKEDKEAAIKMNTKTED